MRQLKLVVVGCAVLAAGAFVACGGDDTGNDAGDATTTDAEGTDVVVSDAGSDGVAPGPDGCVPIADGAACDPGHVTCGSTSCDLTKDVCCVADGGAKFTCTVPRPTDGGKPPPNACTGTEAFCDEAADCPAGQVCCGFVGATGGFATSCATSCGTGLQFCHGNAECVSGTCTAQPCRGETIETCSSVCP